MILSEYEALKVVWDGARVIPFDFESIGQLALEVWLETETDVPGVFNRERVAPQYFNLALNGVPPAYVGGTITLTGDIDDTVDRISIERNTPIKQLCDFSSFAPFHMDLIEFTLDKLTMIIQEIAYRKCSIAVTLPITQELTFNPQDVLYVSMVDFALDKVTAYCLQMATSGADCTNDLENT